ATQKQMQVIGVEDTSEYSFGYAKKIKSLAKDTKADIIFIHNSQSHTTTVLAAVFFGLKTPLALCRTLIKRVDTNFFRKWKYNYSGIKNIISVSYPVVDILKHAVKDTSKLCVVGSVTDVDKFKKIFKA